MASWGNITDIEIVGRHDWKHLRCPIASIVGTNITMQTPGWNYIGKSPTPGHPWNGRGAVAMTVVSWVENAYELLASPGMWYLNEVTGYLYYIPRPGEDMTSATVVLPVLEKLVDASGGSLTTPIHNIVFSGIYFEYGTWLLPSTSAGYADNQASIMWSGPKTPLKTTGNVSFQTSRNIQVTNCVFEHLGGTAIDFGTGAHNNTIIGNHIEDISSDGISLGEVTDYATSNTNQMTDGNIIQDNYIRRVGAEYEDAVGVWVGYSKNTLITHNDIDNTPYTGMSVGWGWGTYSYSANNRIIGNYVGKVMQTLDDGGSVYTLSAQTNSWEIANYYKDSCYQAIYWDEGTAYYTAISNVLDHPARNWVNIGISSIHDNTATNNYSNTTTLNNQGTHCVITNTTYVRGESWPAGAQMVISNAGIEPPYQAIKNPEIYVNDSEAVFDHVPSSWTYSASRNLGDYHGDAHYTSTVGQYVQYTFAGTGITWIGEMDNNKGNVDVYVDGTLQKTVNCYSTTEISQVRLFSATNLAAGTHSIKLVMKSGSFMLLDAFAIVPAPIAPWTPTGLSATVTNGYVFLSWNAVVGASGYNVQRSTTSGGPYASVYDATAAGYADGGLTNGVTY